MEEAREGGAEGWPRPLVEIERYDDDRAWPRARALYSLLFALFWGVGMFMVGGAALYFTGELERGDVKVAAVICLLGSPMVGALGYDWAAPSERRKAWAKLERIYRGDPELVPPPPPADEYPLRLPCGLLLGPKRMMGGVMYLGPGGFLFVPHLRNAPALREPISIGPVRAIVVERVWFRHARLARFYRGRWGEGLRIRWQGGMLLFVVPAPAHTQRLIEAELQRWKYG